MWSVTDVMAIGAQYLPSLANVAKAVAIVSGAVCVEPSRLPRVVMVMLGFASTTAPSSGFLPIRQVPDA